MKNHSAAQRVKRSSDKEFILKKIFSCSKCENKFSDRSAWKRHEIIHTDENPFSCSKWEEKFLDRSAWKIHEKIYTERTQRKGIKLELNKDSDCDDDINLHTNNDFKEN